MCCVGLAYFATGSIHKRGLEKKRIKVCINAMGCQKRTLPEKSYSYILQQTSGWTVMKVHIPLAIKTIEN